MWSLGARHWHHRPQQLSLVIITARSTSTQCHSQGQSRLSFSTAPINPAIPTIRTTTRKMEKRPTEYGRWTKTALIKRIQSLERKLQEKDQQASASVTGQAEKDDEKAVVAEKPETDTETGPPRKKKKKGVIDPSKYSTRHVALKLAYLGKNYGGFEYQSSGKYPTIEEELWKALVKSCLIFPENPDEVNFDSLDYSKCGRTDRGVSAFGQVIALRLRSRRPLPEAAQQPENGGEAEISDTETGTKTKPTANEKPPKAEFNDMVDELPYARLLNRLLPPDIQILAWCPTTPADFSARHHCRERQYRYFFTQPAYAPMPTSFEDPKARREPKDGWLDIEAMRAAAKRYEGLHDFRNFCRIDGSKNMQSFERRIFESDIVEVADVESALPYLSNPEFLPQSHSLEARENFPKVYYFHVRGSAFLWHQIRCMVSVLFSIGQGLEDVSVIDRLFDVEAEPRRPAYVLANETPLVLWDCLFPRELDDPTRKDGMDWVYVGEDRVSNAHGATGLVDHMWEQWRERKMDELLAAQLLGIVASQADLSRRLVPDLQPYAPISQRVFEGGNRDRGVGKYVPLLKKDRLASAQEVYDKDARRRGFESAAHKQEVYEQQKAEAEAAALEAAIAYGAAVVAGDI